MRILKFIGKGIYDQNFLEVIVNFQLSHRLQWIDRSSQNVYNLRF
jgi:hypothetical protein